eukprot:TRINITY_DN160_c0_g5_i2.p1 TRINITY_DN160_c0_g5~~TRINITY_DN160_c0_g5_i2.p1  ORF type:complete len:102 (-),score=20.65 TRINITY_DN160_c0_g5_i2:305-610(-)
MPIYRLMRMREVRKLQRFHEKNPHMEIILSEQVEKKRYDLIEENMAKPMEKLETKFHKFDNIYHVRPGRQRFLERREKEYFNWINSYVHMHQQVSDEFYTK